MFMLNKMLANKHLVCRILKEVFKRAGFSGYFEKWAEIFENFKIEFFSTSFFAKFEDS